MPDFRKVQRKERHRAGVNRQHDENRPERRRSGRRQLVFVEQVEDGCYDDQQGDRSGDHLGIKTEGYTDLWYGPVGQIHTHPDQGKGDYSDNSAAPPSFFENGQDGRE